MKIYFTYGSESRDGCQSRVPLMTSDLADESVDEIWGEGVLEKVPNLVKFICECHRLLKKDGKCTFSSTYYASAQAWSSPMTIRGISECSLNFADAKWRETNKYTESFVTCNFGIAASFAVNKNDECRSDEVRAFWVNKYLNTVQAILFTLTKVDS